MSWRGTAKGDWTAFRGVDQLSDPQVHSTVSAEARKGVGSSRKDLRRPLLSKDMGPVTYPGDPRVYENVRPEETPAAWTGRNTAHRRKALGIWDSWEMGWQGYSASTLGYPSRKRRQGSPSRALGPEQEARAQSSTPHHHRRSKELALQVSKLLGPQDPDHCLVPPLERGCLVCVCLTIVFWSLGLAHYFRKSTPRREFCPMVSRASPSPDLDTLDKMWGF